MPINSFASYPMSWKPDLKNLKPPFYLSLAQQLEADIRSGKLAPHTQLPPQRELADYLDVSLSTITRVFTICQKKGLLYANVGKGTFVSPNAGLTYPSLKNESPFINLGAVQPYYEYNPIIAEAAKEILKNTDSAALFEYEIASKRKQHKKTAKKWLSQFHIDISSENILLTGGTQNALTIALLALFQAGDKILTDSFTYPNFIPLANQLRLQLISVPSDAQGMLPEQLEKQCRLSGAKGIFLMPSCNNPTACCMPVQRRKELAEIIQKHDLILLEDDAYGFLLSEPLPPMATLLPEQTVYFHSLSQSLSAGLRVAYLVFPSHLRNVFLQTTNNVNLQTPLFNAEIASELIANGTAWELVKKKRLLSAKRCKIYQEIFPEDTNANPCGLFQFLPLPQGCGGYPFEMQAKDRGVQLFCSDRFAVGNTGAVSAVRLAICSPVTTEELKKGLLIVKTLIEENCRNVSDPVFIV